MVSGINALPHFEEENPYATPEEDRLGRDAFMKLFLAQMNHQDPLNPMDTSQFSAQLAQFSTLEQLYNVNENLESIESIQSNDSRYQVLNLIGKEVQAESNKLILSDGESAKGAFHLEETAECVIRIYDEDGNAIRDIELDLLEAGNHTFEWEGLDDEGNLLTSGMYIYALRAVSPSGDIVASEKYIQGTITRVNMESEEPVMYIDQIPLTMAQLKNINFNENETETE
ncbi:MAG: flagellar hook capping FlgD N-terminal domain-containing protein [Desulfobacteraceae bacterium]|jgi:flagellar basal-body rod modification protein FlgD